MLGGPHHLFEPPLLHVDAGGGALSDSHRDTVRLQILHDLIGGMTLAGKGHDTATNTALVPHRHTVDLFQTLPQLSRQGPDPALDLFEPQRQRIFDGYAKPQPYG